MVHFSIENNIDNMLSVFNDFDKSNRKLKLDLLLYINNKKIYCKIN